MGADKNPMRQPASLKGAARPKEVKRSRNQAGAKPHVDISEVYDSPRSDFAMDHPASKLASKSAARPKKSKRDRKKAEAEPQVDISEVHAGPSSDFVMDQPASRLASKKAG